MLTIHMPDDREDKDKRRRLRAAAYLFAGALIMTSTFIAYNTQLWFVPVAVEFWWMWAALSQDWEK